MADYIFGGLPDMNPVLIQKSATSGVVKLPFMGQVSTGDQIEFLDEQQLMPNYNWKRVGDPIASQQVPEAKTAGSGPAVSHQRGMLAVVEAAVRVLRGDSQDADPTVLAKAFLELHAPEQLRRLRSELSRDVASKQAVGDFGKAIEHASQMGNLNLSDWIVPHGETWHFEENGYHADCDARLLERLSKAVPQLFQVNGWSDRIKRGGIIWCVQTVTTGRTYEEAVLMFHKRPDRPQLVYFDQFDMIDLSEVNCGALPEGGSDPIPATKMDVVRSLFFLGLIHANPVVNLDVIF
jgi:hypothetical protein